MCGADRTEPVNVRLQLGDLLHLVRVLPASLAGLIFGEQVGVELRQLAALGQKQPLGPFLHTVELIWDSKNIRDSQIFYRQPGLSDNVGSTCLDGAAALETQCDEGGLESVQAKRGELLRAGEGGQVEVRAAVSHGSHRLPRPAGALPSLELTVEILRNNRLKKLKIKVETVNIISPAEPP